MFINKQKFNALIADVESHKTQIKWLWESLRQHECPHPLDKRDLKLGYKCEVNGTIDIYDNYEYCTCCGKKIQYLTRKEWKQREIKIAEAKLKQLKKQNKE